MTKKKSRNFAVGILANPRLSTDDLDAEDRFAAAITVLTSLNGQDEKARAELNLVSFVGELAKDADSLENIVVGAETVAVPTLLAPVKNSAEFNKKLKGFGFSEEGAVEAIEIAETETNTAISAVTMPAKFNSKQAEKLKLTGADFVAFLAQPMSKTDKALLKQIKTAKLTPILVIAPGPKLENSMLGTTPLLSIPDLANEPAALYVVQIKQNEVKVLKKLASFDEPTNTDDAKSELSFKLSR